MKKSDLNYANAVGINVDKIGKFIDQGVHHRVYEYQKNYVIKIPKRRFNFLYSKKSQLLKDYDLLKKYFGNFVVPIKVVASKDKTKHVIIQKRVKHFKLFTPQTVNSMNEQLQIILKQNQKLLFEKKYCLDFLGGEGFISCLTSTYTTQPAYSSNMVIIKDRKKYKLVLIDTELLRMKTVDFSLSQIIAYVLSVSTFITTIIFMKIFFGINLLKK